MRLASTPRDEPEQPEAPAQADWIGVASMLEEVCRSFAAGLGEVDAAVDCTQGLEVPGSERRRLSTAAVKLLARTIRGLGAGGFELVARPTGSPAAPGILLAVHVISSERRTRGGRVGFDADELTLARELVERGGGFVLIVRQLPGERRSTLGLDSRWRIERGAPMRVVSAPEFSAASTPGRQPSGVSSEPPPRYAAAEMPYSLSRW